MDNIFPNPDKGERYQLRKRSNVFSEMPSPQLILHRGQENDGLTLETEGNVIVKVYDQTNSVSDKSPIQTMPLGPNVSTRQGLQKRPAICSPDNTSIPPLAKKKKIGMEETLMNIFSQEADLTEQYMEDVETHTVELPSIRAQQNISCRLEMTRQWLDNISNTSYKDFGYRSVPKKKIVSSNTNLPQLEHPSYLSRMVMSSKSSQSTSDLNSKVKSKVSSTDMDLLRDRDELLQILKGNDVESVNIEENILPQHNKISPPAVTVPRDLINEKSVDVDRIHTNLPQLEHPSYLSRMVISSKSSQSTSDLFEKSKVSSTDMDLLRHRDELLQILKGNDVESVNTEENNLPQHNKVSPPAVTVPRDLINEKSVDVDRIHKMRHISDHEKISPPAHGLTNKNSVVVDHFEDDVEVPFEWKDVLETELLHQYRLTAEVDDSVVGEWDEEEIAENVRMKREQEKLKAARKHEERFEKYIKYELETTAGFELRHISPKTIRMRYKLGEMHPVLRNVEFEYRLVLRYDDKLKLWKVFRMDFPLILVEERSRFCPGVPDSELVSVLWQIYESVKSLAKDQAKIIKYRRKRNIRSTEIAEDWRDEIEI